MEGEASAGPGPRGGQGRPDTAGRRAQHVTGISGGRAGGEMRMQHLESGPAGGRQGGHMQEL